MKANSLEYFFMQQNTIMHNCQKQHCACVQDTYIQLIRSSTGYKNVHIGPMIGATHGQQSTLWVQTATD